MSEVTSDTEMVQQSHEDVLRYIDFTDILLASETISTLTSILEVTTSELTLTVKAIILSEITVDGRVIAANKGVEVKITGGAHGKNYRVEARVATNMANDKAGDVILKIRDC